VPKTEAGAPEGAGEGAVGAARPMRHWALPAGFGPAQDSPQCAPRTQPQSMGTAKAQRSLRSRPYTVSIGARALPAAGERARARTRAQPHQPRHTRPPDARGHPQGALVAARLLPVGRASLLRN